MSQSKVKEKSFQFSIDIIRFHRTCAKTEEGRIMGKQLLRSATSVGANIEEALTAQSRRDFIHKMSISRKEAFESVYWLKLFKETELAPKKEVDALLDIGIQLTKMLSSIILTSKENNTSS